MAQAVLSEVLYNEPESRVELEWIEIFNPADTAIDLAFDILIINGDTFAFPAEARIPPASYAIIARRLVGSGTSDSYEGHWGDSSGYWGDSNNESYAAFDINFSLANSLGSISLVDTVAGAADSFSWQSAGEDGHSFERNVISPPSAEWHQCQALDGSTPGRANSPPPADAPYNFVFTVEPKIISLKGSSANSLKIDCSIPAGCILSIYILDDTGFCRRHLLENNSQPSVELTWNGVDDNSRSLAPGIYFVVAELTGIINNSKTIPVVIAP